MPRELRTIILDDSELIDAIHSYRRVHDDVLPPGTILSVENTENEGVSVQIEMKFGPNVRKDSFVLTNKHLIETLVRFCLENNIVIPRNGRRRARYTKNGWTLQLLLKGEELEQAADDASVEMSARVRAAMKTNA